ncbi:MAG: class I SAM-dependent methyltransferase [Planctomycetes bacterium]|nr:class I SAM-dependent methyltransferase [Planctomycetota bacterium]
MYEKGKQLEKYFILKQRKGEALSSDDEKRLFSFLSTYPNYPLEILLSWNHPGKDFLIRKERILKCIEGENGRLLEIACSVAPWLEDFVHYKDIPLYIGCDISHFALRVGMLSQNYSKSKFLQCHAEQLPFKNGSFEIIVASEVMEHLKNPESLCNEAFRILRGNGVFIVSLPMHVVDQHNITDTSDFGDFTHNPSFPNFKQLKDLFLRTNFVVEDIMIDPYYIFKLRKIAGVTY